MIDVSTTNTLSTEDNTTVMKTGVRLESDRAWMGPGVLILDIMSQSLLVDKAVLKVRTSSSFSSFYSVLFYSTLLYSTLLCY